MFKYDILDMFSHFVPAASLNAFMSYHFVVLSTMNVEQMILKLKALNDVNGKPRIPQTIFFEQSWRKKTTKKASINKLKTV